MPPGPVPATESHASQTNRFNGAEARIKQWYSESQLLLSTVESLSGVLVKAFEQNRGREEVMPILDRLTGTVSEISKHLDLSRQLSLEYFAQWRGQPAASPSTQPASPVSENRAAGSGQFVRVANTLLHSLLPRGHLARLNDDANKLLSDAIKAVTDELQSNGSTDLKDASPEQFFKAKLIDHIVSAQPAATADEELPEDHSQSGQIKQAFGRLNASVDWPANPRLAKSLIELKAKAFDDVLGHFSQPAAAEQTEGRTEGTAATQNTAEERGDAGQGQDANPLDVILTQFTKDVKESIVDSIPGLDYDQKDTLTARLNGESPIDQANAANAADAPAQPANPPHVSELSQERVINIIHQAVPNYFQVQADRIVSEFNSQVFPTIRHPVKKLTSGEDALKTKLRDNSKPKLLELAVLNTSDEYKDKTVKYKEAHTELLKNAVSACLEETKPAIASFNHVQDLSSEDWEGRVDTFIDNLFDSETLENCKLATNPYDFGKAFAALCASSVPRTREEIQKALPNIHEVVAVKDGGMGQANARHAVFVGINSAQVLEFMPNGEGLPMEVLRNLVPSPISGVVSDIGLQKIDDWASALIEYAKGEESLLTDKNHAQSFKSIFETSVASSGVDRHSIHQFANNDRKGKATKPIVATSRSLVEKEGPGKKTRTWMQTLTNRNRQVLRNDDASRAVLIHRSLQMKMATQLFVAETENNKTIDLTGINDTIDQCDSYNSITRIATLVCSSIGDRALSSLAGRKLLEFRFRMENKAGLHFTDDSAATNKELLKQLVGNLFAPDNQAAQHANNSRLGRQILTGNFKEGLGEGHNSLPKKPRGVGQLRPGWRANYRRSLQSAAVANNADAPAVDRDGAGAPNPDDASEDDQSQQTGPG